MLLSFPHGSLQFKTLEDDRHEYRTPGRVTYRHHLTTPFRLCHHRDQFETLEDDRHEYHTHGRVT